MEEIQRRDVLEGQIEYNKNLTKKVNLALVRWIEYVRMNCLVGELLRHLWDHFSFVRMNGGCSAAGK